MFDTLNSNGQAYLGVIEQLRDDAIKASIDELSKRDRLTIALRTALKNGMSIDDLSAASGLPCAEIKRRVEGELLLGEDLDALTGIR